MKQIYSNCKRRPTAARKGKTMELHTIEKLFDNVFVIHEGSGKFVCNAFLVLGQGNMLLIDTGMGTGNIKSFIESVTDYPGEVVLTHGHIDHSGGAGLFSEVHISPADFYLMKKMQNRPKLIPMWEGETFDLGSHILEVIWMPGHTPGSCVLLDRKNRLLFAGDTVSEQVFMGDANSDFDAMQASLEKLRSISDDFDFVIASHAKTVLEKDIIDRLSRAIDATRRGYADKEMTISGPGMTAYMYEGVRILV